MVTAHKKKEEADKLWLLYFNRRLFEKGIITEPERNRMMQEITRRHNTTSQ